MIGKSADQKQRNLFNPLLTDFINMGHELVLLANKIEWKYFEKEFSGFYSITGQPAIPIRMMVGCLLLKQMYNLGDETLAQSWVRDPYMQYFCGEAHFQHKFPFDPSDFVHFRKRIGLEGVEKIFKHTVTLHGEKATSKMVLSDTTVQENFVTYPTDAKQYKRVIDDVNRISEKEGYTQRQRYTRISKQLLRDTYNGNHPRRKKKARKAIRSLCTIGSRVVRELERNMDELKRSQYSQKLDLYSRILSQKRNDKDKIYSLHKPYTACIAKGKAAKQYEYGNKVGLMTNSETLTILAIKSYEGNPHDSKTIEPLLEQMKANEIRMPQEVVYDRGGKGEKEICGVKISTPGKPKRYDTSYEKRCKREKFRRRAAIEPVIGHLKSQFRMGQNYLSGKQSPQMNAFLSAAAWNLKKLMEQLIENGKKRIFAFLEKLLFLPIINFKIAS